MKTILLFIVFAVSSCAGYSKSILECDSICFNYFNRLDTYTPPSDVDACHCDPRVQHNRSKF